MFQHKFRFLYSLQFLGLQIMVKKAFIDWKEVGFSEFSRNSLGQISARQGITRSKKKKANYNLRMNLSFFLTLSLPDP